MSSFDNCLLEVEKLIKRQLTPEEKKDASKKVGELIEKFDKEGVAGELNAKVLAELDKYGSDLATAAIIEKRNTAMNEVKKIQMFDYVMNTWGDNPVEGIKALTQGSLTPRLGSRNSADAAIAGRKAQYRSGLMSKLAEKDLTKIAASGEFDDQLHRALIELTKSNPNSEVLAKLLPESVEIAKIMADYLELSRVEANKVGAWINKLEGRGLKRTHDPSKISKAAGRLKSIKSTEHMKAWVDYVKDIIDWDKTIPGLPRVKQEKILQEMFVNLATGKHLDTNGSNVSSGFKGAKNLGKSMSQERVLHFKTPEAEFEYHKKFSRGDTVLSNVMNELEHNATNISLMEKFGPNAEANFDAMVNEVRVALRAKNEIEMDEALALEHKKIKKKTFPILTGAYKAVESNTLAKASSLVRKVQRTGDLAFAAFSTAGDFLSGGGTNRYIGNRQAGEFFEGVYNSMKSVFGNFSKMTPEQKMFAAKNSILMDAMNPSPTRVDADFSDEGAVSKWLDNMFKYNGISFVQDRLRLGAVMLHANKLHDNIGKSFDELSVGLKSWFEQFEISPSEWDLMRSMETHTDTKGRSYLFVDAVDDIPLEKFDFLDSVRNSKNKDLAREKARTALKQKFAASNADLGAMAATEPSTADIRLTNWGDGPGSFSGEFAAHIMMYKSFMVTYMRKHLGRELHGYNSTREPFHKAFTKMWGADKGGGFLAAMIPTGIALGYATNTLTDLFKGKAPREPKDWKDVGSIMTAGLARTGGLGIYGDFLFGDMKSRFGRSYVETLAGPTAGRLSEVADIFGSLKEAPFSDDFGKDAEKTRNKIVKFAMNNAPGLNMVKNHFATKMAFDYLINYNLHEMMNPGYLKRMEKNLKAQKQQEYILRPSSVIKTGGGFK